MNVVQCECRKYSKLCLPDNFFSEGIGGGFGHAGHPLTTPLMSRDIAIFPRLWDFPGGMGPFPVLRSGLSWKCLWVDGAVEPVRYHMIYASSCDVPCDYLLGSVCQRVIDSIHGETLDMTIALMHVNELFYALVARNDSAPMGMVVTVCPVYN